MTASTSAALDAQALRRALGLFATGVAIVTALDDTAQPLGMTVNSFSSVSLDPPIVLWSIRKAAATHAAFTTATHFAINVLDAKQTDLSNRYAGRDQERFGETGWHDGAGGAPVLRDAFASFECRRTACVEMGDHSIIFGAVLAFHAAASGAPLVFSRGRYARVCADLASQCEFAI